MKTTHTVRSFDQELDHLTSTIARMGTMSVSHLDQAVQAVRQGNTGDAQRLIEADAEIDALEQDVHAHAVRVVALRQPMADDLRSIVCALKISSDFERIGDYAANICKRGVVLESQPSVAGLEILSQMVGLVQDLMTELLAAYQTRDIEKALNVRRLDRDVDALFATAFDTFVACMSEDSRNITACTHLVFIAKGLERAGDHVVNAAATVHFLITGQVVTRTVSHDCEAGA